MLVIDELTKISSFHCITMGINKGFNFFKKFISDVVVVFHKLKSHKYLSLLFHLDLTLRFREVAYGI